MHDVPEPETSSTGESIETSGGKSSTGVSVLGLSLSKRKVFALLGVLVVVSLILWRLRASDDSGGSNAKAQIDRAREDELAGEVEVDDENDVIQVPVAPDDELQKDAAVLEALKRNDSMKGEPS